MRSYPGVNLKTISDPATRRALWGLDAYARQTGRALSRSVASGPTPLAQVFIPYPNSNPSSVVDAQILFSDITTGNASTTEHGFLTKLSGTATTFLDGTGAWDSVRDSDLSLSDTTANDVSTSQHGFVPKAPNDTAKYLRGDATWATVSAGPSQVYLVADDNSFTDSTLKNVSGLSFSVTSGHAYYFQFFIGAQSDTATVGIKHSVTFPSVSTYCAISSRTAISNTDGTGAYWFGTISASGDAVIPTSVATASTNQLIVIEGIMRPDANGTLQAQVALETGTSAVVTVAIGSCGFLWDLGTT